MNNFPPKIIPQAQGCINRYSSQSVPKSSDWNLIFLFLPLTLNAVGNCKIRVNRNILVPNEMKWNQISLKTKSESLRKVLINTIKFHSNSGQNFVATLPMTVWVDRIGSYNTDCWIVTDHFPGWLHWPGGPNKGPTVWVRSNPNKPNYEFNKLIIWQNRPNCRSK